MDPGRDIEPISESTYRTSSECCNLPNIIVFANEYMIDHRSYAHNLSSCGIKAWTGFKPMISVIPVQCFANWDIKPSGSWSLCVFVIYEKMKNLFFNWNLWKISLSFSHSVSKTDRKHLFFFLVPLSYRNPLLSLGELWKCFFFFNFLNNSLQL